MIHTYLYHHCTITRRHHMPMSRVECRGGRERGRRRQSSTSLFYWPHYFLCWVPSINFRTTDRAEYHTVKATSVHTSDHTRTTYLRIVQNTAIGDIFEFSKSHNERKKTTKALNTVETFTFLRRSISINLIAKPATSKLVSVLFSHLALLV